MREEILGWLTIIGIPLVLVGGFLCIILFIGALLAQNQAEFEKTHRQVCDERVVGIAAGDSKVIIYNLSDGTRDMSQQIFNNGECFKSHWEALQ